MPHKLNQLRPRHFLLIVLLLLVANTLAAKEQATEFGGVRQLVARRFPFMVGKVVL